MKSKRIRRHLKYSLVITTASLACSWAISNSLRGELDDHAAIAILESKAAVLNSSPAKLVAAAVRAT